MSDPTTELSRADVEHVALLARLALSPEDIEHLRTDLVSILGQVALLNEVDTAAIPPSSSIHPLRNVMQDDVERPSLPVAAVLANAPAQADDQFLVPAIFEE